MTLVKLWENTKRIFGWPGYNPGHLYKHCPEQVSKGESYIVLFHLSQFDCFFFAFRLVRDIRNVSVKQKTFRRHHCCVRNTTEVPGSSESCQEYLRLVGDTKVVSVTLDTCQGHQGHQRPVNDTRDVSGVPHSCLECVSQVYSLWTV